MIKQFTRNISVNCRTEKQHSKLYDLLKKNGYIIEGAAKSWENRETTYSIGCFGSPENEVYISNIETDKVDKMQIVTYPEFLKLIGKEKKV